MRPSGWAAGFNQRQVVTIVCESLRPRRSGLESITIAALSKGRHNVGQIKIEELAAAGS
jgi:hypothetical protein